MSSPSLYPSRDTSTAKLGTPHKEAPSVGVSIRQTQRTDDLIVKLVSEEFKVSEECVRRFIAQGYRP
jgi:hypothetical protein